MSMFRPVEDGKPCPWKRVKFFDGLVLEVEEFVQEQTYIREHMNLQSHTLHGYGTVIGLNLIPDGNQLTVTEGLAIDPLGREVAVRGDQCADLAKWFGAAAQVEDKVKTAYVTLAYRECSTDPVAVPALPCTEGDSVMDSRLLDSFVLSLEREAPHQAERHDLAAFRRRLEYVIAKADWSKEEVAWDKLEAQVIEKVGASGNGHAGLTLARTQLADAIRAAYGYWIRELRPASHPEKSTEKQAADAVRVLLGTVRKVTSSGKDSFELSYEGRPFLFSTDLLQEQVRWNTQMVIGDIAGGDLGDHYPDPKVKGLRGRPIASTTPGPETLLTFHDNQWEPRSLTGAQIPDAAGDVTGPYTNLVVGRIKGHEVVYPTTPGGGDVMSYDTADSKWHVGPLALAGKTINGTGLVDGDLLKLQGTQWVRQPISGLTPALGPASGDLSGTYPDLSVERLQKIPIKYPSTGKIETGSVLRFDGDAWRPVLPRTRVARLALIRNIDSHNFEICFDPDHTGLPRLIADPSRPLQFTALGFHSNSDGGTTPPPAPPEFKVSLDQPSGMLWAGAFIFGVEGEGFGPESIQVVLDLKSVLCGQKSPMDLLTWTREHNISWVGASDDGAVVTIGYHTP